MRVKIRHFEASLLMAIVLIFAIVFFLKAAKHRDNFTIHGMVAVGIQDSHAPFQW